MSREYASGGSYVSETGSRQYATPDGYLRETQTSGTDGNASGATLTATVSLIAGAATGAASATGATLTVNASLISGTATGAAAASGSTLIATVSLLSGVATGDAAANGATLSAAVSLVPGVATGEQVIANVDSGGSQAAYRVMARNERRRKRREAEAMARLRETLERVAGDIFDPEPAAVAAIEQAQEIIAQAPASAEIQSRARDMATLAQISAAIAQLQAILADEEDEEAVEMLLLAA